MTDILGVGAGPVGLATMISTILKDGPRSEMIGTILEGREEYSRSHTVHLDEDILKKMRISTSLVDPLSHRKAIEFNQLLLSFSGNTPISTIEQRLSDFAESMDNITIRKGAEFKVLDEDGHRLSDYIQQYGPQVVFATGGSRCAASAEVFGVNRRAEDHELDYILKAKFQKRAEEGARRKLPLQILGISNRAGRIISPPWYSRTVEDGMRRGQVFMTIREDEVRYLEGLNTDANGNAFGTYRNPITPENLEEPFDDEEASIELVRAKKMALEGLDLLDAENIQVTLIKLSAYRQEQFYRRYNGAVVISVGDAAGGVPYQRSLCGCYRTVVSASNAAFACIRGHRAEHPLLRAAERIDADDALVEMQDEMDTIWKQEIFRARVVAFFFMIINAILAFFSNIYWDLKELPENSETETVDS